MFVHRCSQQKIPIKKYANSIEGDWQSFSHAMDITWIIFFVHRIKEISIFLWNTDLAPCKGEFKSTSSLCIDIPERWVELVRLVRWLSRKACTNVRRHAEGVNTTVRSTCRTCCGRQSMKTNTTSKNSLEFQKISLKYMLINVSWLRLVFLADQMTDIIFNYFTLPQ